MPIRKLLTKDFIEKTDINQITLITEKNKNDFLELITTEIAHKIFNSTYTHSILIKDTVDQNNMVIKSWDESTDKDTILLKNQVIVIYDEVNDAIQNAIKPDSKEWSYFRKCCSAWAHFFRGEGLLSKPYQLLRLMNHDKITSLNNEITRLFLNRCCYFSNIHLCIDTIMSLSELSKEKELYKTDKTLLNNSLYMAKNTLTKMSIAYIQSTNKTLESLIANFKKPAGFNKTTSQEELEKIKRNLTFLLKKLKSDTIFSNTLTKVETELTLLIRELL